MDEQPKDFVTLDEAIEHSYKAAPWWMKVLYQMNEHPIWTAVVYILIGLMLGTAIGGVSDKY